MSLPEVPQKIDPDFYARMNPPSFGLAEMARRHNEIVAYLEAVQPYLEALKAFSKPVDEMIDRKLGPHPDVDPELRRKL